MKESKISLTDSNTQTSKTTNQVTKRKLLFFKSILYIKTPSFYVFTHS